MVTDNWTKINHNSSGTSYESEHFLLWLFGQDLWIQWVMSRFLKFTAYQLSVTEQKCEEHTAMTGLPLWLKGTYTYYWSQKSVERSWNGIFSRPFHMLLVSFTWFQNNGCMMTNIILARMATICAQHICCKFLQNIKF